ncbi:type II toxin-antitoxin system VapC family toxin [Acidobacteria bacterium AH-259-O06]|nr:type II toxin-antitoxin system VapC family toxin [Acidobacteria bacterium AH-259-O06]
MIFVDTNVLMYAVGRKHPLRPEARDFFEKSLEQHTRLITSPEVFQELLHPHFNSLSDSRR